MITEEIVRHVPHGRVLDFLKCGWGLSRCGPMSCVMYWRCKCKCVEPIVNVQEVAGEAGFEPAIPVLETGALGH